MFIGRISSLALGPYSFENVKAGFCLAEGGTLASSEIVGVLGAEVLRRFRVIFDYSHKTVILEPAEGMADSFKHDMSGLELRTVPGDLKTVTVRRVVEGTPAAEAGVLIGDILLAVDGHSTRGVSLPELRELLRPPGTVRLTIRRGSELKELFLVLRRLI